MFSIRMFTVYIFLSAVFFDALAPISRLNLKKARTEERDTFCEIHNNDWSNLPHQSPISQTHRYIPYHLHTQICTTPEIKYCSVLLLWLFLKDVCDKIHERTQNLPEILAANTFCWNWLPKLSPVFHFTTEPDSFPESLVKRSFTGAFCLPF